MFSSIFIVFHQHFFLLLRCLFVRFSFCAPNRQMIIVTSNNKQRAWSYYSAYFSTFSIRFHGILNKMNDKNEMIPFFMWNDLLRWWICRVHKHSFERLNVKNIYAYQQKDRDNSEWNAIYTNTYIVGKRQRKMTTRIDNANKVVQSKVN